MLLHAVTESSFKCDAPPPNNLKCCPCPAVRSESWSWQEKDEGVKVSVSQSASQPGAASWCHWRSLHSDCKGDPSVGEAKGGGNS